MKVIRTQEGEETWNTDGNITSCEIKYFVYDQTDRTGAMAAVLQESPEALGNVDRQSVRFDSWSGDRVAEISVTYSSGSGGGSGGSGISDSDDSEPVFSFDCSGGTKHINHAISQRCVYGDLEAGSAIGWNGVTGDGMEVTGCDIATGQLRETYEKVMRMRDITTARKRSWNSLVGKVNRSTFKGWNPGEVMFLGCSFSGVDDNSTKIKVQFSFAIQENESNAVVDGIRCGSKKGFEYIWAISSTQNDSDGTPTAKVKAIYIAQVCQTGDFSKLGL